LVKEVENITDQSILDVLSSLRSIVASIGGALNADDANPESDLIGQQIIADYLSEIASAFREAGMDGSSVTDDYSCLIAMTANLAQISKTVA
jgi:hypothetical protein